MTCGKIASVARYSLFFCHQIPVSYISLTVGLCLVGVGGVDDWSYKLTSSHRVLRGSLKPAPLFWTENIYIHDIYHFNN